MIDTRYPPRPASVRVPLYPLQHAAAWRTSPVRLRDSREKLRELVAAAFECPRDSIVFGRTGAIVLANFLRWYLRETPTAGVALPSFYCPRTALTLLQVGCRLALVDTDAALNIPPSSVDAAVASGCKVMIWPSFFGARARDPQVLMAARMRGIDVIYDDAHAFPHGDFQRTPYASALATLFSFGHSKPIAGVGGGGLFIHDPLLAAQFSRVLREDDRTLLARCGRAAGILLHDAFRRPRPTMRSLGPLASNDAVDYRDQRERLEALTATSVASVERAGIEIDSYTAAVAVARWKQRAAAKKLHRDYCHELVDALTRLWGSDAVTFVRSVVGPPTVMALRLEAAHRYQISSKLAAAGIETTWYYFPLHRLTRFARLASGTLAHAEQVSAEILILPCQWIHAVRNLSITPYVLRSSDHEVRDAS